MDNHTEEQRRKNMQAVKNKDSKIELLLRQKLWKRGLRYQKNRNDIFGKPDIVFKGKKMAGRMGHDRVTVKNLVVSYIDSDHNLIGLKGAVPGPNKGLVMVEGKD